jgi:phenylpyruvate tautomerase PptA (4-oxalocrotonate tautomerase family)
MFPRLRLRIVGSEAPAGFGQHGSFSYLIAESPPSCQDRKLPSMSYVRVPTITFNAQSRLGRNGVRSKKKFIRKERSMPTYVCYLPRDRFSPDQKRQIVDAITFRHSEATGAPSYFVQVVIEEARADRYLGGEHTSDHIWVRGDIRAGRTEEQRTGMMTKMMQDISLVTSVKQENVWIYLCNLDPTDMIEYGHVLPAPGQEKAWFESLPASLRTYLAKLGTTKANFKL